MSNMNNIENERILAFAKEYAELCRKHGLYLVFNDDVWLQYAGNEQDLAEVEPNLVEILGEDRKIEPADQWTQEEQAKFTEEDKPVIVFNRVSGNKVDDDILLCAGISGEAIGVPHSETQDEYIDKIMLDVMQAEGTLYSEQGTDFARTVAKRAIAEECERCAKVCENLGMNAENERMFAYAIRNTGMV